MVLSVSVANKRPVGQLTGKLLLMSDILVAPRVYVAVQFGHVFHDNAVIEDFHLALVDKTVHFVLYFLDLEAGPSRDLVYGDGEGAAVRRFVDIGQGFVEHQEDVADAGELVRDGKDHEAPFLRVDALNEGFQELHGYRGISHHKLLEIRLVELQGLDVIVGYRRGGPGGVFKNRHFAEYLGGLQYIKVFLESVDYLDKLNAPVLYQIKTVARLEFRKYNRSLGKYFSKSGKGGKYVAHRSTSDRS